MSKVPWNCWMKVRSLSSHSCAWVIQPASEVRPTHTFHLSEISTPLIMPKWNRDERHSFCFTCLRGMDIMLEIKKAIWERNRTPTLTKLHPSPNAANGSVKLVCPPELRAWVTNVCRKQTPPSTPPELGSGKGLSTSPTGVSDEV